MRKENIYLIVIILVAITGGVIFFINGKAYLESKKKEQQEEIIDCLFSKEIKLYLSSDCNYCEEQKDIFGEYFDRIDVVNCGKADNWSDECKNEGINSVPAWTFPDNVLINESKILSCSECKKKNNSIICNNYCYTESGDGTLLRISGFLDLDKLTEIFECSPY